MKTTPPKKGWDVEVTHGVTDWLIVQSRTTAVCVCPSLTAAEGNSIIHPNATSESPCGISCYSSVCTDTSGQLQLRG